MPVKTTITSRGVIQEFVRDGGSAIFEVQVPSSFSGSVTSRQQYVAVGAGTFAVEESHLGSMLEVDPAAGSTTIQLPIAVEAGFFASVRQVNSGTVQFAGSGGATVRSVSGSVPMIRGEWSHVTIDKRNTTTWVVAGDILT